MSATNSQGSDTPSNKSNPSAIALIRELVSSLDNHDGNAYCEMGVDRGLIEKANEFLRQCERSKP